MGCNFSSQQQKRRKECSCRIIGSRLFPITQPVFLNKKKAGGRAWVLKFGATKTSAFSTNTQSSFMSVVFDTAWDFVSQYQKLCTRRVKVPWRTLCQLKKPLKGSRQRRGCCWEKNGREKVFPWQGVYLPSLQINYSFIYLDPPNIWLLAASLIVNNGIPQNHSITTV